MSTRRSWVKEARGSYWLGESVSSFFSENGITVNSIVFSEKLERIFYRSKNIFGTLTHSGPVYSCKESSYRRARARIFFSVTRLKLSMGEEHPSILCSVQFSSLLFSKQNIVPISMMICNAWSQILK